MQEEWTEKYRPKSLSDIVGNEMAAQAVKRWGESWKNGIPHVKALILRGEPGIGKTSAALALARDMGWDFIEMNASDHRNAASIKKVAGAGSVSQTFTLDGEFLSTAKGKRKLIIMDEADNLFGREDYGGAKAIVDVVRESAQPMVLIVNDYRELTRKSPAVKNLALTVVFKRLAPRSIITVLRSISSKEGVEVVDAVLARIAENSGGDMRAAVNDLQMLVEGRTVVRLEDPDALGKRNQEKELNAALYAIFGAKSVRAARDATFDLDKTPEDLEKWIEEGIPKELPHAEDMAAAFDALSKANVYLGRTRKLQHYGLWSYAKELMTGGVALARKTSPRPRYTEYGFPSHFIMLSRAKGPRLARDSISGKLAEHMHTSKKCVNESTLLLLSAAARNDREFLLSLASGLALDEGDISYLLGVDPSSEAVQHVVANLGFPEDAGEPTGRKKGRGGKAKSGLAGF
jgi:replication factor C large subunit